MPDQCGPPKKSMRCYYEDCRLKVVTRGGSEFVNNIRHKIASVMSLDEGILIKAFFNPDLYAFELGGGFTHQGSATRNLAKPAQQSNQSQSAETFVYLSLHDHPLDDATPIAFDMPESQMINTQLEIVHADRNLPFVVVFDHGSNETRFCLIQRVGNGGSDTDSEKAPDIAMQSIDQDSRGAKQQLPSLIGASKIILKTIFQIDKSMRPESVVITQCLTSNEMLVCLYLGELKRVNVYACDLRSIQFKKTCVYPNVAQMLQTQFSKTLLQTGLKMASKDLVSGLFKITKGKDETDFQRLKSLKRRLKSVSNDLALLSSDHQHLTIYPGGTTLGHSINLDDFLGPRGHKLLRRLTWTADAPSTFQAEMADDSVISLEFSLLEGSSFLVGAVLRVLRDILSGEAYQSLVQDVIGQIKKKANNADSFDKLGEILLSCITEQKDLQMLTKGNDKDFTSYLMPPKEEQKAQSQEKTAGGKVLRVSSASTKIKPISKDADKRIATISVSSSAMKGSPTKYQGTGPSKPTVSAKLQVKKITKQETSSSPIKNTQDQYSKAVLVPNAFELMLKSPFGQTDKLFQSMISELDLNEKNKTEIQTEMQKQRLKQTPIRNNLVKIGSSPSPTRKKEPVEPKRVRHPAEIAQHAEQIFKVLHLMHEELRLNKILYPVEGPRLRKFLFAMALVLPRERHLNYAAHMVYYATEDPVLTTYFAEEIKARFKGRSLLESDQTIEAVPKIFSWIQEMLARGESSFKFPVLFSTTRILCRLYEVMTQQHQSYFWELKPGYEGSERIAVFHNILLYCAKSAPKMLSSGSIKDYLMLDGSALGSLHLFEKVLYCLKEELFAMDQIQQLPDMISLPLLEIIRYTRLYQQQVQTVKLWPTSLYRLIRREDIINNLKLFEKGQAGALALNSQTQALKEPTLQRRGSKNFAFSRRDSNVFSEQAEISKVTKLQNQYIQDLIGEEKAQDQAGPQSKTESNKESMISEFLKNRFGKDSRYREAEYLLSSVVDMVLKPDNLLQGNHADQVAMNEEEKQRRQKLQLDKLFTRHLSKCIGRGALTLGTQETLPTETLQIPKISQQGYVIRPNEQDGDNVYGQTVTVNLDAKDQRDLLQWPSFHNGVATALKISQLGFKRNLGSAESTNASNINHARDWIMFHKPQEPKNEHGGFLLGIGLLGQLDSLRPTDLYQHLKSAHDSTTIGILLGRAVSQIGKMDDADSRTMCLHIPSLLPQNLSVEISLPVQSAAVIGAGLLYQQTQNRLITEMLLSQIARKPTSDKMIEREGYALASGIALGLVNLAKNSDQRAIKTVARNASYNKASEQNPFNQESQFSELTDLQLDDRLIRFIEGGKKMPLPRSMLQTNQNHDQNKSSAIKENEMVNIYVTSSGALFALTLIHLKSNNQTIANRLQLPDSFFTMEFVRPISLLQKVLCRNLIMWDQIQPSEEWVYSNIPQLIKQIYEADMQTIEKEFNKRCSSKEIDFATVALCYVNILAGASFSVGFKYAGTGNLQAKQLIESLIAFFRKQLKVVPGTQPLGGPIQTNTTSQTKNQVDRSTVETCLCVLALSLGMIMAGKCDVSCFRTLRVLRKRFEGEMHYGYNMAINLAIGFLFLGSGAYTFSRSNEAIAALLCATYPVFPSSPSDNRYHLQALRHFYVLAIETRLLQARDIDTDRFVNIDVLVTLEDDANQEVRQIMYQTPDIINGKILSLQVRNSRDYHDVTLDIAEPKAMEQYMQIDQLSRDVFKNQQSKFEQTALQRVIYVKRKNLLDKQEAGPEMPSELADAVRQSDVLDETTALVMHQKATNALTCLQRIKDRSIEVFMRTFASTLFSNERPPSIVPMTELNLNQTLSFIQDVLLASTPQDNAQDSFAISQLLMKDLEIQLFENSAIQTYQEHYVTLLALNESIIDDKVSSLPLLLRVATSKKDVDVNHIECYMQFLSRCRQRGLFVQSNQHILQPKFIEAIQYQNRLHPEQAQLSYVASLGETLLTEISPKVANLAKIIDPCQLQAYTEFIRQVLQQASEVYEPSALQKYLKNAKTQGTQPGELHDMLIEALKCVITNQNGAISLDDEMIEKVILPGLIQAI